MPMEYYYSFQNWLYQTDLYQDILREMPAPLNNIYFDTVLVLGLVVYLIYRIIEWIRIRSYHKRMRKNQEKERQTRRDAEEEMKQREQMVKDKETRINHFMEYMYFWFSGNMRSTESDLGKDNIPKSRPRLDLRRFYLEKKKVPRIGESNKDIISDTSAYDDVLGAFAYDEATEQEITRRKLQEQSEINNKLHSLDDELKVEVIVDAEFHSDDGAVDIVFEKKKKRALQEEEKERKREEKLLRKKERGGIVGRFRKKN